MQGLSDISATSESLNHAREFANSLLAKGLSFDRVYSSGLQRSIETAEIFQEVLSIRSLFIEPDFNERGQGDLEGLVFEEADRLEPHPDVDIGEDKALFRNRVRNAYKRIREREKEKSLLFVLHSGTLKALFEDLEGVSIPHNVIFLTTGEGNFIIQ